MMGWIVDIQRQHHHSYPNNQKCFDGNLHHFPHLMDIQPWNNKFRETTHGEFGYLPPGVIINVLVELFVSI